MLRDSLTPRPPLTPINLDPDPQEGKGSTDTREELDFMFDEELDEINVGRANNFTEW